MTALTSQLKKVLQLEQSRGYRDVAVLGAWRASSRPVPTS
jgi:hypothetical protein